MPIRPARGLRALKAAAPIVTAAGLMLSATSAWAATTDSCSALQSLKLHLDGTASVVSINASTVPAASPLPAYCDVNLVVSSNADPSVSQIQIEVGMPVGSDWNGRLLGTGNGGFAGAVSLDEIKYGMSLGFAAANSDLGTGLLYKCSTLHCGDHDSGTILAGMYRKPQAIRDFGHLSMHLMTLAAKELIAAYYAKPQTYSYFMGCSTGGQNAMMEGLRYPTDYDGIVAGDPANNRTHLHIASAFGYLATHYATDAAPPASAAGLAHAAVLKQCAGSDGGSASDAYLMQPQLCTPNLSALQCTGASGEVPCTSSNSASSCTCIIPDQVKTIANLYVGAKDDGGNTLYPGYEPGTEDPNTLTSGGLLSFAYFTEPLFDGIMYWGFGPNWKWQSLFATTTDIVGEKRTMINAFDHVQLGVSNFAVELNATTTNWSEFYTRGGKLIMYHGSADPLIPTASTYDYYNALIKRAPAQAPKFSRLYLAPGVFHCTGGPGPDSFGDFAYAPKPLDPSQDVLGALMAWREKGQAPGPIIATKYAGKTPSSGIVAQRPLCPYPQHAVLTSGADPTKASSFQCAAGPLISQRPFGKPWGY